MNSSVDPTLRQTEVPAVAPELPRSRRTVPVALRLFADHGWAARLWFGIALAATAAALIEPPFLIAACRTRERVVILDEAGTFHVSPLLNFEEATQLHTSQALLACLALFQKSPSGFDYPDILDQMFLPEAMETVKALGSAQTAEFKAKQIHQKVEVFRIDILQTRDDLVLVEVTGQLLRVGLFNGVAFNESPKFKARLTLARNPNLTRNGRYPMAVWKLELK